MNAVLLQYVADEWEESTNVVLQECGEPGWGLVWSSVYVPWLEEVLTECGTGDLDLDGVRGCTVDVWGARQFKALHEHWLTIDVVVVVAHKL